MASYIVAGRTEDGSVWATGSITLAAFGHAVVSWGGTKEQATVYSEKNAQSIIDNAPKWIFKLTMTEVNIGV